MILLAVLVVLTGRSAVAAPPSWIDWSVETLRKSVAAGKPVLVVVGDSTCDRCSEVENEIGDAAFTRVKLDQDLYPAVARAYAPYAGAAAGQTDLPFVLVLTPQLEPIAAISNPDVEHLRNFVSESLERWNREPQAMIEAGGLLVRRLQLGAEQPSAPSADSLSPVDRLNGTPVNERGDAIIAMAQTAVYDQLGGGFHRRAREASWQVPQFEKRIADQAAIASFALDAWSATHDRNVEAILRATLDCIVRDFTDPQTRTFANAIESHSLVARKGAELLDGGAYVWKHAEVAKLLGNDAAAFETRFGILPDGNVPHELDTRGDFEGVNTLFVAADRAEMKRKFSLTDKELDELIDRSRAKLLAVRLKRPQPAFDRRALTSTDAAVVSVLARAGVALDSGVYQTAAAQALRALVSRNMDAKTRRLFHFRGTANVDATLEDYTWLIGSLLDVYAATFDSAQLELALALQQKSDELFPADGSRADAAIPAAVQGSLHDDEASARRMGRNLVALGSITGSEPWRLRGASLLVLDPASLAPPQVVVVVGSSGAPDTQALLRAARLRREPLLLLDSRIAKQRFSAIVPSIQKIEARNDATATICTSAGCRTEVTDPDALRALPE